MKLKIIIFLTLGICFLNSQAFAQKGPEKIKAVKSVTGTFTGFEAGDYLHANIKKSNGKTESYWITGGLEYFLAVNNGKKMNLTYEVVDVYVEEAGSRIIMERLKSAKIGTLTSDKWWKDLRKKYSFKQIDEKYRAMVDKQTKQN